MTAPTVTLFTPLTLRTHYMQAPRCLAFSFIRETQLAHDVVERIAMSAEWGMHRMCGNACVIQIESEGKRTRVYRSQYIGYFARVRDMKL